MGLDSVELLMGVEKYFGIEVPDFEAEKAYSVQALMDIVARLLNISDGSLSLRDTIFDRVNQALLSLGLSERAVELNELVSKYLNPGQHENWEAFKNELQLEVPKPETSESW